MNHERISGSQGEGINILCCSADMRHQRSQMRPWKKPDHNHNAGTSCGNGRLFFCCSRKGEENMVNTILCSSCISACAQSSHWVKVHLAFASARVKSG